MFRVHGRRIYPSTLRERRMLLSLGSYPLYAPRGVSPYVIARKLSRAAAVDGPEVSFVRDLLARRRRPMAGQSRGPAEQAHEPADPVAA
jgi:hypothetical protein